MTLLRIPKHFLGDDSGAVTVDWVVLTAATVGLAIGAVTMVAQGLNNHADSTEGSLAHMAHHLANGYVLHP